MPGRAPGLFLLLALGSLGCSALGPRAILAGRGAYAEVINRTEDEQLLNVIVRQRYDETFGMLAVASVTANLSFRAGAEANVGIGDSSDYAGNLVPLSGALAYEENPTISYVPLSGEDFMVRMLSPISVGEWLRLGETSDHPGRMFTVAVRSINGLRNPLLRGKAPSPEFTRLAELYTRLRKDAVLDVVEAAKGREEHDFWWELHDYAPVRSDDVREFLELLGIHAADDGSAILLPVRPAVGRSSSTVQVQTRSAWDVLRLASSEVEVPAAHLEAGFAAPVRSRIPGVGAGFFVRVSEERPEHAAVRIRYRGWWYYVDARDTRAKRDFQFFRSFLAIRLADPTSRTHAPLITVPVK